MEYLAIAATVMGVAAQLNAGQAKSQQYQSAAQASAYNAAVNRARSENALSAGNQREEQQRRYARIQLGRMRAAGAQAGLGLDGSTADLERQSETMAELDALNIRYESQLQAQGLRSQSALDDYQSSVYRSSASAAERNSYLGAAAAMLQGASDYGRATRRPGSTSADTPTLMGMYD